MLLGHPLLSSPFAILCQAGLIQLTALSGKGVNDGPWPRLGTKPQLMKMSEDSGGAGLKAPKHPAHKGARSTGLRCGGALFRSSEIPSYLQDTQPSPEAISPGPACHMLSPPISMLALHALEAARMRILCSLGNYSPTALSAVSPGHRPHSPKQPASFPGEPAAPSLACAALRAESL